MLPHNHIGAKSITRLKVYNGAEHNHAAQKPVAVEIK
jgi:large subunit ribosomal protein L13